MTLEEAKNVITREPDAPIGLLSHAAGVICAKENASQVSLLDLVECLKRNNLQFGKVTYVSEIAALTLYYRTGRKRKKNHAPYEDFITDAEDWFQYLRERSQVPDTPG